MRQREEIIKIKTTNNVQHVEKTEGNNIVPIDGSSNEQYAQLISMFNLEKSHASTTSFASNAIFLPNNENKWVLDSIVIDLTIFQKKSSFLCMQTLPQLMPIKIPDGYFVLEKITRKCFLTPRITIKDVLHVLWFPCNRISINKLTKTLNCDAYFFLPFMFYSTHEQVD